jgi:hypothetical protein
MSRSDLDHHLEAASETVWSERHVVEYLLFKMTTAKLLLAADERRFVAMALDEVERVVDRLRACEAHRALALAPVAEAWGTDVSELTLAVIAARAPVPWNGVFSDHHATFEQMAAEIEETCAANRALATSALGQVRHALEAMSGPSPGPSSTAAGRARQGPAPARLNRAL